MPCFIDTFIESDQVNEKFTIGFKNCDPNLFKYPWCFFMVTNFLINFVFIDIFWLKVL